MSRYRNTQCWQNSAAQRYSLIFTVDLANYSLKLHILILFFSFLLISRNFCCFIGRRASVPLPESLSADVRQEHWLPAGAREGMCCSDHGHRAWGYWLLGQAPGQQGPPSISQRARLAEVESFEWGCLRVGAVSLYPTGGLISVQGSCGNSMLSLLSQGAVPWTGCMWDTCCQALSSECFQHKHAKCTVTSNMNANSGKEFTLSQLGLGDFLCFVMDDRPWCPWHRALVKTWIKKA